MNNLFLFLPGILFLALVALLIAIPFAGLVKNRLAAAAGGAVTATLVLKVWAMIAMGGFDLTFLLVVIAVSVAAACAATLCVSRMRERAAHQA